MGRLIHNSMEGGALLLTQVSGGRRVAGKFEIYFYFLSFLPLSFIQPPKPPPARPVDHINSNLSFFFIPGLHVDFKIIKVTKNLCYFSFQENKH